MVLCHSHKTIFDQEHFISAEHIKNCIKKEPTLSVQFLHQYKETRSKRTLIVQED